MSSIPQGKLLFRTIAILLKFVNMCFTFLLETFTMINNHKNMEMYGYGNMV